jgi:hypothetical protein
MKLNKKYLFFLRREIRLLKIEKQFIKLYSFKELIELLRNFWLEMSCENKKELGYN